MGDELKSAYELAMERLAAQDAEAGAPVVLTDDQKEAIARVRAELDAKLAELEIMRKPEIAAAEARGLAEEAASLQREYEEERASAEADAQSRIASIRDQGTSV